MLGFVILQREQIIKYHRMQVYNIVIEYYPDLISFQNRVFLKRGIVQNHPITRTYFAQGLPNTSKYAKNIIHFYHER